MYVSDVLNLVKINQSKQDYLKKKKEKKLSHIIRFYNSVAFVDATALNQLTYSL